MRINFAHVNIQGINCAIFDAKPLSPTEEAHEELLADLVQRARANDLRVDKAALAYASGRQIKYWGHRDLAQFLANNGPPRWTHYLDV